MSVSRSYFREDTIAGIATPLGGAISLIRISGPHAFLVLESLTGSKKAALYEARKLFRTPVLLETGELLDDALMVRFPAPHSYSGEDVLEIHLHGGVFIAPRLMETLAHHGIRQALPGEFSFRAVRNGKLTLFQAQAVADLIGATDEQALGLALEKLSGTQNKRLESLAQGLRQAASLAELGIDFSDQDVEELSLETLQKKLTHLHQTLETWKATYERGSKLREGIRVAFIGLPNAGKSSFFNAILGQDRSIVSEHEGTTRDVIGERITLRGKKTSLTLRLEDTAGVRKSDHPIEKIGIERSLDAIQTADLLLWVIDPLSPFEQLDALWDRLHQAVQKISSQTPALAKKTLGILTKSDQRDPALFTPFQDYFQGLGISQWVMTSSVQAQGIEAAIEKILECCETQVHREKGELILTRLDHLSAVEEALNHLNRAQDACELPLFASDLRQALHSLAPLIGETLPDDILGQIFSSFCIGK
ncbi:MAG: tRNA uridine-5-carboxymethylaminomethyl(34) synthesis GTPase MnmE [Bdellovibrionia bacterium]